LGLDSIAQIDLAHSPMLRESPIGIATAGDFHGESGFFRSPAPRFFRSVVEIIQKKDACGLVFAGKNKKVARPQIALQRGERPGIRREEEKEA
jgi:hypothetical protein